MMNKNNDGFTLIEMVVAMTLFVAVIVTVMSIFLRSVQTERGVAGQSATIANVSLAIEEIAREMRTASSFTVPQQSDGGVLLNSVSDCSIQYPSITFTYTNGFGATTTVSYSRIKSSTTANYQITQTINGQSLPMTPAGTNITKLNFIITNQCPAAGGRKFPPRITIAVQGINPANEAFGFVAPFNLETTVSQRLYYYQ